MMSPCGPQVGDSKRFGFSERGTRAPSPFRTVGSTVRFFKVLERRADSHESDIEIAQACPMRHIREIAGKWAWRSDIWSSMATIRPKLTTSCFRRKKDPMAN